MISKQQCPFYGSTTLGEKGQVVIPQEVREKMKLQKGDKLLVFGMGEDMVAFSKLSHLEKFEKHLSEKLTDIRRMVKDGKN
ncbi:MAG: AbrB/MazE/SpoVT family DNA-binding domain-containing protein [Candidatus Doudnabacteria bacterium]|nr:AbrB/MazE/SpoVT family DNA-binding domain-containing protein [Candidatus Doudnabacteria bacterium]